MKFLGGKTCLKRRIEVIYVTYGRKFCNLFRLHNAVRMVPTVVGLAYDQYQEVRNARRILAWKSVIEVHLEVLKQDTNRGM